MVYLIQFEFEKDKGANYWMPLLVEVESFEDAKSVEKDVYTRLKRSFKKVNKHAISDYNDSLTKLEIVKDYIDDERKGEFDLLRVNPEFEITEVDDNANREVVFDEQFSLKEYQEESISYLDFNKKRILTRKISDNINKFDEYLVIKLSRKTGFIKMDPKKNPGADLEKLRGAFILAGIIVSMFLVYSMINMKFYDVQAADLGQLVVDEEDEDIIPITEQTTPPPPPPPPPAAPEVIEIVEDDEDVEDLEIEDTEADAETVVETFEIEEEVVEEEVFTIVENMPEFPGGQKKLFEYLGKNIKFPPAAKANGISGKVYVNFTVNKDGKITNVKVLRGVHELLDKEAIRVVKAMPPWKPGKQRGKAVRVSYNLPINFILK